ncbi:MAG: hypothetical protein V2B18_18465, partial [Pseudomonadota bacterium]
MVSPNAAIPRFDALTRPEGRRIPGAARTLKYEDLAGPAPERYSEREAEREPLRRSLAGTGPSYYFVSFRPISYSGGERRPYVNSDGADMDPKKPGSFNYLHSEDALPDHMPLGGGATETLNLDDLFPKDITETGSFDLGAGIWAGT